MGVGNGGGTKCSQWDWEHPQVVFLAPLGVSSWSGYRWAQTGLCPILGREDGGCLFWFLWSERRRAAPLLAHPLATSPAQHRLCYWDGLSSVREVGIPS